MLATNVLLATLVIPVAAEKVASEAYLEIDSTQEKQQRLAVLVRGGLCCRSGRSLFPSSFCRVVIQIGYPVIRTLFSPPPSFRLFVLCCSLYLLVHHIAEPLPPSRTSFTPFRSACRSPPLGRR